MKCYKVVLGVKFRFQDIFDIPHIWNEEFFVSLLDYFQTLYLAYSVEILATQ